MDSRLLISFVLASFCFMYSDALTCYTCASAPCSITANCSTYLSTQTAYCYYYTISVTVITTITSSYSGCDYTGYYCSGGSLLGSWGTGKCCTTNLCNSSKAASVFPNKLALMVAAVCAIVFAKMHI